MSLADLDYDERVILVALIRYLVNLDDLLSANEMAALRTLQRRLGEEWSRLAQAARDRYHGVDDAIDAAGRLVRPESRKAILDELQAMAETDGVIGAEIDLLDRVRAEWSDLEE